MYHYFFFFLINFFYFLRCCSRSHTTLLSVFIYCVKGTNVFFWGEVYDTVLSIFCNSFALLLQGCSGGTSLVSSGDFLENEHYIFIL